MPLRLPSMKDPDHRALRRASRVAIVAPLTLLVALRIPFLEQGALMAAFACISLMIFADFGGPMRRRWNSYLATTFIAAPLIVLGAYAGQRVSTAVAMAFVVALSVGLLATLRGMLASAQTVFLLALVLSLTSGTPQTAWPFALSWVFGGIVASIASVTLWPLPTNRPIRDKLAEVIDLLADTAETRWLRRGSADELRAARERVDAALTDLHRLYDGNLQRPSGLTASDRALSELVDEVSRLRYLQKWQDVAQEPDPQLQQMVRHECGVISAELRRCADRLRGGTAPLSPAALFRLRTENLSAMADWLAQNRADEPAPHLREQIEDAFPMRISTLVTARIMEQTMTVEPRPGDEFSNPPDMPAFMVATTSRRERLRAQLSWSSPWFRNAIRTAVALGISVWVAESVTLEHPFWITLGTLSALRFDALGTGRTALQGVLGTTLGVAFSAAVVVAVGAVPLAWWAFLPLGLFAAAYTPATVSYVVGQASFSFAVISLFAVVSGPALTLAGARLVDVSLGILISLLVSVLMWPRGVQQTLRQRLSDAMQAATDYYLAATDWMAGGAINDRLLASYGKGSRATLQRAQEAVDLSIAQRPPQALAIQPLTSLVNTIHHVDFASRMMPGVQIAVTRRGGDTVIPAPLVGPLLSSTNEVRDDLNAATSTFLAAHTTAGAPEQFSAALPDFSDPACIQQLRTTIDEFLDKPGDWPGTGSDPRPVVITWLTDWAALFERSAQTLDPATRR